MGTGGQSGGGSKILRVGILSPIHTLNPRECRDLVSTTATAQVFDTPFRAGKADAPPEPVLFTGPLEKQGDASLIGLVRPGLKFSDGTPLTAAHIATSLSHLDDLKQQGITVDPRDDRVSFHFKTFNPRFDLALTMMEAGIVLDRPGKLLGSGAFTPAPGVPLEGLRLQRNPNAAVPALVDEVRFVVYPPDADGRPERLKQALAAGEVDFTNMLSRTDAGDVSGVRKAFQPSNSTAILYFNVERPGLTSPEVRRALAHAIDRLALTQVSYSNALAFAATSLLPPTMGAARDGFTYSTDRAKALLGRAGLVKPGRLRLLRVWAPRPYLPNPQPVAELIARHIGELGIPVDIVVPRNSEEFFRAAQAGDYDLLLGGWIADTPDPADFLEANLRSDRVQVPGNNNPSSINRARFRSPDMDAALAKFRSDPTPSAREGVLRILDEQAPAMGLMYGPTVVVSAWRVRNVEVSALGVPNFATVELD